MNKTTHSAAEGGLPPPKAAQHSDGSVQEILPHLQMTTLCLSHLPQCRNADGCTTIHFLLPRSSSYTPPFHFSTPTPAPIFHFSTIQYLLSSLASRYIFFKLKTWRLPFIITGIKHSLLFIFQVRGSQNKGSILSFYYCLYNSLSEVLIKFSRRLHEVESTRTLCTALFSTCMCVVREYKRCNRTKSNDEIPVCAWYRKSWEKAYFLRKDGGVQHLQFPPTSLRRDWLWFVVQVAWHLKHIPSQPRVTKGLPTQQGLDMSQVDGAFALPSWGSSRCLKLFQPVWEFLHSRWRKAAPWQRISEQELNFS